jgi:hypothetical protein
MAISNPTSSHALMGASISRKRGTMGSDVLSALANLLAIINTYAPTIQTFVIIAALIYAAAQTSGLRKQIKLNLITSTQQHLKDVNEILTRDRTRAVKVAGETDEDALASIILGTFELWFLLDRAHLTDRVDWRASQETIKKVMSQPFMADHWYKGVTQRQYRPDFVAFMNDHTNPMVPPRPAFDMSQTVPKQAVSHSSD